MEEIDLKEIFQLLWRKKVRFILIILLFIALGIGYTEKLVVPRYESSTKLLLAVDSSSDLNDDESITTTDVTLNSNLVSTYSELVKSNKIIRQVISNLGIDSPEEEVRNNVKVSAISDTEVIEIKVQNEDPVVAAKIANEISKVFIDTVKEYYGIENVHIVDEAEVSNEPYNVNHIKDIIIFVFVGCVFAIVVIFMGYMFDTTIKSVEDIENKLGVRVIATLPLYEGALEKKIKNNKRGGK